MTKVEILYNFQTQIASSTIFNVTKVEILYNFQTQIASSTIFNVTKVEILYNFQTPLLAYLSHFEAIEFFTQQLQIRLRPSSNFMKTVGLHVLESIS